ncbi:MAG: YibE/F family protein, partial [Chloroflexota bacterium]|nr:YibE/F family protein [Chloroflexota bacterium]
VGGLVAVGGLGAAALAAARMTGYTTEDAATLAAAAGGGVDVARIALAGVIAASIGALVDVGVAQSRAVLDLAVADPDLRGRALYLAGARAGRAHLGPLMGTLTFAYLGAALPLVLLVFLDLQPLSATLNGDRMVAALVTVLVASLGLGVAVPIATAAAAALAPGRAP